MKQHSPGCTCCKPSLFTNDLSYARILENSPTFISDGPFAAPRGLSFGVDSHGDHDTYDFPWWAKIWGGILKHMGRDGGFSAILGDLFGWGDFVQGGLELQLQGDMQARSMGDSLGGLGGIPEELPEGVYSRFLPWGRPCGIFRDKTSGHFLIQSMSIFKGEKELEVFTGYFGDNEFPWRFRWGAFWYDLTLNEFVGENHNTDANAPVNVPVTTWGWTEPGPSVAFIPAGGVKIEDEIPIILSSPESTPDEGGRKVANHGVVMWTCARSPQLEGWQWKDWNASYPAWITHNGQFDRSYPNPLNVGLDFTLPYGGMMGPRYMEFADGTIIHQLLASDDYTIPGDVTNDGTMAPGPVEWEQGENAVRELYNPGYTITNPDGSTQVIPESAGTYGGFGQWYPSGRSRRLVEEAKRQPRSAKIIMPNPDFTKEVTEKFVEQEELAAHGVVMWKDGKIIDEHLIPGAISPAISSRTFDPAEQRIDKTVGSSVDFERAGLRPWNAADDWEQGRTYTFTRTDSHIRYPGAIKAHEEVTIFDIEQKLDEVHVGATASQEVTDDVVNDNFAMGLGKGSYIYSANGDTCHHLVYGRKYSGEVREYEVPEADWAQRATGWDANYNQTYETYNRSVDIKEFEDWSEVPKDNDLVRRSKWHWYTGGKSSGIYSWGTGVGRYAAEYKQVREDWDRSDKLVWQGGWAEPGEMYTLFDGTNMVFGEDRGQYVLTGGQWQDGPPPPPEGFTEQDGSWEFVWYEIDWEYEPEKRELQVPILQLKPEATKIPSEFPYEIDAPLEEEINDNLSWGSSHAATFLCKNSEVIGALPTYVGLKYYVPRNVMYEQTYFGERMSSSITQSYEFAPRIVAAQPDGVLIYSTAKNKVYFIGRVTGETLVVNYDKHYAETESLQASFNKSVKTQGAWGQVVDSTTLAEVPTVFPSLATNPFIVLDGSLNEVGRFNVDKYYSGSGGTRHYHSPAKTPEELAAIKEREDELQEGLDNASAEGLLSQSQAVFPPPGGNIGGFGSTSADPQSDYELFGCYPVWNNSAPVWAAEGWDGKIYFGTSPAGDGQDGTFQFDPSDLTMRRVFDGRKHFEHPTETRDHSSTAMNDIGPWLAEGSDTPRSKWYPGWLSKTTNMQAFPRNPTDVTAPAMPIEDPPWPPFEAQ